jgi:WD40 repeat protein
MRFRHDLAFHPDSRRLATVGAAGVQVWDVTKGTAIRALSPEEYDHVSWSLDGKSLLVVKKNSKAAIFESEGSQIHEWPAPAREWNAFTLEPNGQSVITGGEDRMIHVRDMYSGKELARWQGHEAPISVLTFSPDGKYLVSGARDGTIKLWDLPYIRKELAALGLDW